MKIIDLSPLFTILIYLIPFDSCASPTNQFAPSYWPKEPRLEKEWLTTFDIQQGHVTVYKEYSRKGKLTPLTSFIPTSQGPKKISGYDLNITGYQNFVKGFFINGSATYQSIRIATPSSKLFLTKWSDLTIQAGWTYSYKETTDLDFVDYTFKAGFYKPNASLIKNEFGTIFKMDTGGILTGQVAFGLFEWLTIGFNCETIITKHEKRIEITPQTLINGNVIIFESFIKADHVVKGFSCGFGYTFSHEFEKKTKFCTNPSLINASTQHDIHIMLEYDFTKKNSVLGPRIGFAFNATVGGKNCLKSSITQGTTGVEISFKH